MLPRLLAALLLALPSAVFAASDASPYLNVEFSAPYIKANVSLTKGEASARLAVGGSYTLYSAGFLSTAASVSNKSASADFIAANIATPGLIPVISSNEFPNIHLATAGASVGWSLSKLNGTLAAIVGAKGYASSVGQVALAIIEFNDVNSNDKIDENETVSVYSLHRSFGIMSCSSNSDALWCNSTSTDKVFNMLTTVSKSATGRTQYGEIITPRHAQVVYTIRDFPYKSDGTKLALRSIVASANAAGSAVANLTASGKQGITAVPDDASLQVFFGWGGRAQLVANSKEVSARVAGAVATGATVGIDDKTLSGYIKAFGMAEASVKVVDVIIDTSSNKAEFVRVSSAVGSGALPEESGLSTGALIGIIAGSVAVVVIIAVVVAVVVVRRRRAQYSRLS